YGITRNYDLAEDITPRRDLWPLIQAELPRHQQKRKRWQLPPFGPLFMHGGHDPALRLTGISLGSVAVVLLLAWLVLLPPGQNPSQYLLARNARAYWYDYTSGPVTESGADTYAAFFQSTGDNPIIYTDHNNLCSFGVDVGTRSYAETRNLVISAGRLPEPGSVRLEGFINSFDHGYQPPTEGLFAIHIEGAPSPFGGENQWLLRIGLQARTAGAAESAPDSPGIPPVIARNVKAWVDFNPEVVSSYRQLGYEYRRVPYDDLPTSSLVAEEVRAGHSVTALFEVSLREGFWEGAQGRIATVHTKYQDPDTNAEREIMPEFNSTDLELIFEQTTPYFQRDAAVAEYAEVLRESHWAQGSGLADVEAMVQQLNDLFPGDRQVAEFAELVRQSEDIDAMNAS
ncbi:MAG: von Willebrand factor type A domain-containing protein, partial [Dehalococcoidia bacterium]